jgi:hypothetical protein
MVRTNFVLFHQNFDVLEYRCADAREHTSHNPAGDIHATYNCMQRSIKGLDELYHCPGARHSLPL